MLRPSRGEGIHLVYFVIAMYSIRGTRAKARDYIGGPSCSRNIGRQSCSRNVVAGFSPRSILWLDRHRAAGPLLESSFDGIHSLVGELHDQGKGYLFRVRADKRSFVLKGQAELVHADSHHITLADVVPENGVVVLSLHYQKNLRASPSRVQIECEIYADDPIGFLRLRVASRVSRLTLTWDNR